MKRSVRTSAVFVLWLVSVTAFGCAPRQAVEPAAPQATAQAAPLLSGAAAVEAAGLGKMWTFDNVPLDYLGERYAFTPTREWFEHVRLASLRTGGCSASFVSADGLVMTNHHCARGCISAVSTPEHDYMVAGFYAPARDAEPVCPGQYVEQLISIEDVTARVDAAAPAGAAPEEATRLKQQEIGRIEGECRDATGHVCSVVSLYNGGIYSLYRYKRYGDVRLVFAPEGQAAFYGGDPDNFTYPRHDVDVTLLRAYEDGEPVHPEHYFKWSESGAAEGELVFVTGNPGSTGRLLTYAQLEYLRDAAYPTILTQLGQQVGIYRQLVAEDPSREPRSRNAIFGLENSIKAYGGYQSGLLDEQLMARKAAWERSFRAAVDADPKLKADYGGAWDEIARVNQDLKTIDAEARYSSFSNFRVLTLARLIVDYADQMAKPEAERSGAYRGDSLQVVQRRILSTSPIDLLFEERLLTARLGSARDVLGAGHPFIQAALQGREPAEAARALVGGSRLADVEARRALLDGSPAAVQASDDPAIVLARATAPRWRELVAQQQQLRAVETVNQERVAKALFHVYGTALPPDATFTLRLSDGVVQGYPLNGTFAPYKTTFYGLYDRAASFDYKEPWHLTARWIERKGALDLATPLNFVCTADIIGGNSGSPVINRNAEVVGLVFDGNMEMLPNRFLYTDAVSRTVAVHSEAIIEALRKIYDAGALADELEGRR
jgi:hypothetical protein